MTPLLKIDLCLLQQNDRLIVFSIAVFVLSFTMVLPTKAQSDKQYLFPEPELADEELITHYVQSEKPTKVDTPIKIEDLEPNSMSQIEYVHLGRRSKSNKSFAVESIGLGVSFGYGQFEVSNIEQTLIRIEDFNPDSYSTSTSPLNYGVLAVRQFSEFTWGINLELALEYEFPLGGDQYDFEYDDVNGLEYSLGFRYHYLNFCPTIKYELFEGGDFLRSFGGFVGFGLKASFNVAQDNIYYESNMPRVGPDETIRERLRNSLSGQNTISLFPTAGMRMGPFFVEGRYIFSAGDAIEVENGTYNLIEVENERTGFLISAGILVKLSK